MTAHPDSTFSNSGFGGELRFRKKVGEGWPTIRPEPQSYASLTPLHGSSDSDYIGIAQDIILTTTVAMASDRWRQIEELYQSALKLGAVARSTLLAGADPDLRREVEALLAQGEGSATVTQLGAGMQLGAYRIEALLGQGGIGVVYRAIDTKFNRPVAIKFLSNELADAEARRRFQREAQMASSLNHPHILTVYDAGDFEGRQYLVTEFVDGGTLKSWAKQEKRTWRQFVELLTGVADGLAAAHQAGILHRDIKPDNVLVAKNGYAKLADFGLAKLAERPAAGGDLTRTLTEGGSRKGVIIGTIAYMSPEQASGKALDARSDIFSFGVVLYEMFSGHRPFQGASDLEVLKTIIHAEPSPLSDDVPLTLRTFVEKALEKDPAERYQSMRDLVVDLRRVARNRVEERPRTAAPPPRTRWLPWAAVAAIALGTGLWLALRPAAQPDNLLANAQFTRLTDFPGDELGAAISPDGKFVAFLADRDGPFDIFLSQVGSGNFTNLTHGKLQGLEGNYRTVGFSGDGSEIWLHDGSTDTPVQIMPLMGGQPRVFLEKRSFNVAWSPDGARLIYHTADDGDPMFVADSSGANVRQIFVDRPGMHNHFPVWSRDGRWIYFVHGIPSANEMDLWRISSSGGTPERLTQHSASVGYPAPIDQRTVLYVAEDTDGSGPWLWALDVERKLTRRISLGLDRYTSVATSADGRHLVASVANPVANLWSVPILDRLAEERDVKPFPLPTVRALMPRFGGAALFYVSSRGGGDGLWRYQDGQAQEIWKGAGGALREPPAVAPDGRRVAFVQRRNGRLRLQIESADGTEPRLVEQNLDVQRTACWSPDAKWIVTGGSDGRGTGLFKIPVEGGSPVRLTNGLALNPVWSPDGRLIAYAGANVGRFAPLLALRPDGSRIEVPEIKLNRDGERIRFLPNGKGLVYMQGQGGSQDFWLLDLATKKSRPLTRLNNTATMRTFDITPDGKQIVFDRLRENSDIVLIDLPKRP
jgi:serine/threonine protein kinase/Tol biopolymer transport system component